MNAVLGYKFVYIPHPWDEAKRKKGVEVWCLIKEFRPEKKAGPFSVSQTPIALFNFDSEALQLQRFVYDGHIIEADRESISLFEAQDENDVHWCAWVQQHNAHGPSLDELVFLPSGEKPETKYDWVRVPWLDGVL